MAIDSGIYGQVQQSNPLNALASGYQLGNTIRQQPMVDQMNQQKLQAGEIDLQNAKLKQQEAVHTLAKRSMEADYYGAVQMAPYLQSGDMNSVLGIINQRKAAKQMLGYPTTSEDEFAAMLQSNPEQAKKSVANMMAIGQKLFGAQKGTYGALTPAIGPDGKPVYIQSDPSGGQPNVVQGYAPMPTAADQAAALQAQQNAAMARLLSGGVGGQGGQGGPIPSPNAPAGSTNPFAGMTKEQIEMLPPEIQRKAFEAMIDPRTKESQEQQTKKAEFQARAATLLGDLIGMPSAVKSAVGTVDSMTPTIMPSTAEAENKIAQLRSILTADNLKLMTGVLSETDMKVLREISAGQLDTKRDQNAFLRDLNTLYEKLSGMSGTVQRGNSTSGNTNQSSKFTSSTGIQFTVE